MHSFVDMKLSEMTDDGFLYLMESCIRMSVCKYCSQSTHGLSVSFVAETTSDKLYLFKFTKFIYVSEDDEVAYGATKIQVKLCRRQGQLWLTVGPRVTVKCLSTFAYSDERTVEYKHDFDVDGVEIIEEEEWDYGVEEVGIETSEDEF